MPEKRTFLRYAASCVTKVGTPVGIAAAPEGETSSPPFSCSPTPPYLRHSSPSPLNDRKSRSLWMKLEQHAKRAAVKPFRVNRPPMVSCALLDAVRCTCVLVMFQEKYAWFGKAVSDGLQVVQAVDHQILHAMNEPC